MAQGSGAVDFGIFDRFILALRTGNRILSSWNVPSASVMMRSNAAGAPRVYQEGRICYKDVLEKALGSRCRYKGCMMNMGSCDKELSVALQSSFCTLSEQNRRQ